MPDDPTQPNSYIKYQRKWFLFNFNSAYIYTFLAGICVSIAANLFTTALLTKELPITHCKVYVIASLMLLSSIGAFAISVLLGNAKSEWETSGKQEDSEWTKSFIKDKFFWIMVALVAFLGGIIISVILYFA